MWGVEGGRVTARPLRLNAEVERHTSHCEGRPGRSWAAGRQAGGRVESPELWLRACGPNTDDVHMEMLGGQSSAQGECIAGHTHSECPGFRWHLKTRDWTAQDEIRDPRMFQNGETVRERGDPEKAAGRACTQHYHRTLAREDSSEEARKHPPRCFPSTKHRETSNIIYISEFALQVLDA